MSSNSKPPESNVVNAAFGADARRKKHKRSSLCENGHHKWEVKNTQQFDVRRGKLITVYLCSRCGQVKNKLV